MSRPGVFLAGLVGSRRLSRSVRGRGLHGSGAWLVRHRSRRRLNFFACFNFGACLRSAERSAVVGLGSGIRVEHRAVALIDVGAGLRFAAGGGCTSTGRDRRTRSRGRGRRAAGTDRGRRGPAYRRRACRPSGDACLRRERSRRRQKNGDRSPIDTCLHRLFPSIVIYRDVIEMVQPLTVTVPAAVEPGPPDVEDELDTLPPPACT